MKKLVYFLLFLLFFAFLWHLFLDFEKYFCFNFLYLLKCRWRFDFWFCNKVIAFCNATALINFGYFVWKAKRETLFFKSNLLLKLFVLICRNYFLPKSSMFITASFRFEFLIMTEISGYNNRWQIAFFVKQLNSLDILILGCAYYNKKFLVIEYQISAAWSNSKTTFCFKKCPTKNFINFLVFLTQISPGAQINHKTDAQKYLNWGFFDFFEQMVWVYVQRKKSII